MKASHALLLGLVLAAGASLVASPPAVGEFVRLSLESYAPAQLPAVTTTLEVPDINDQLEMSRQAVLFALSPSGWDLAATGAQLHSLPYWPLEPEKPKWSAWVWGIRNLVPSLDSQISQRLGYELNAEAIANPGPNGPEYFLWFHTDAWAERLDHNVGESPNNYGAITGCMGGVWFQCPVPNWGRFSVDPVPEPATVGLLLAGALTLLRRRARTS
jgi:hypothetical protein